MTVVRFDDGNAGDGKKQCDYSDGVAQNAWCCWMVVVDSMVVNNSLFLPTWNLPVIWWVLNGFTGIWSGWEWVRWALLPKMPCWVVSCLRVVGSMCLTVLSMKSQNRQCLKPRPTFCFTNAYTDSCASLYRWLECLFYIDVC